MRDIFFDKNLKKVLTIVLLSGSIESTKKTEGKQNEEAYMDRGRD